MATKPISAIDASWVSGVNTTQDPRLPAGYYVRGVNVTNRGGIPKTRPGTRFLFNLPSPNVQAHVAYEPSTGHPSQFLVIDGYLYISEYPFRRLRRLSNTIRVDTTVQRVEVCQTTKFVQTNADGSLTILPPRKVLIVQDGKSAPVYYDGYTVGKLVGTDVTPQGTVMAWSGNRLWVARRDRLFASNFGDPYTFTEQYYLGGSDSLLMPGNVTAMAEAPGATGGPLLVFTSSSTVGIRSDVQTRASWPDTEGFQRPLFPHVGCVARNSVVAQYGYLWWMSQKGWVAIDLASQANVSSALPVADNEMSHYKRFISPSDSRIAATSFENLLLIGMPYGGRDNRHTWVLDSSVIQVLGGQTGPAWSSVWTGFRPVGWAKLTIMDRERLYLSHVDEDGNAQLLEMFAGNHRDSGQDIECSVELRALTGDTPLLKKLRYSDLTFSEVLGTVDFAVDWRGYSRGAWKRCLDYRARVGRGSIRSDTPLTAETRVSRYIGQMRRIRTQDVLQKAEVEFSTRNIEVDVREGWDWAFQFCIRWSGQAALREFSVVYDDAIERVNGACAVDDAAESYTKWDGRTARTTAELQDLYPVYEATATETGSHGDFTVTATRTARSLIAARVAEKMAEQAAKAQVAETLKLESEPTIGPGSDPFAPEPSTPVTLALFGDSGMVPLTETANVAAAVQGETPDWIVHLGDANYPSGSPSTIVSNYTSFWYGWTSRIFQVFGNHDLDTDYGVALANALPATGFLLGASNISSGRLWYKAELGPLKLFVLNTGNSAAGDNIDAAVDTKVRLEDQMTWLETELGNSPDTWNVVVMHRNAWSSESEHYPGSEILRRNYAGWGADIVISAHSHWYERLSIGGIPHLVCGSGGASLRGLDASGAVPGSQAYAENRFGYLLMTVSDAELTVQFKDTAGSTLDSITLT